MNAPAYKVWSPSTQMFVSDAIVLKRLPRLDYDGTPLYEGDIVRTELGIGTLRTLEGKACLELLGHDTVLISTPLELHFIGSQYTHLPDGSQLILED